MLLVLTVLGEVALSELILLDLEATLEQLHGAITTDGGVDSNVFIPLDAEGPDGVLGLGLDGLLVGEILNDLGGLGELIAGLTSAQMKDEFVNVDGPHLVVLLLGVFLQIHVSFLFLKSAKLINNNYQKRA